MPNPATAISTMTQLPSRISTGAVGCSERLPDDALTVVTSETDCESEFNGKFVVVPLQDIHESC